MLLLIVGVATWALLHLLKRLMPGARASLDAQFGVGPAKGIIALILLGAILMMIFGFIHEGPVAVYSPPSWGVHVNNLLMLIAVFMMGAGSGKGVSPTLLRHPMLSGIIVWACAHLLANGDQRSIILFGGLAIWAVAEILIINAREGAWDRPKAGPWQADIKTVVISLVIFGVIAGIHHFIGRSPFGVN